MLACPTRCFEAEGSNSRQQRRRQRHTIQHQARCKNDLVINPQLQLAAQWHTTTWAEASSYLSQSGAAADRIDGQERLSHDAALTGCSHRVDRVQRSTPPKAGGRVVDRLEADQAAYVATRKHVLVPLVQFFEPVLPVDEFVEFQQATAVQREQLWHVVLWVG